MHAPTRIRVGSGRGGYDVLVGAGTRHDLPVLVGEALGAIPRRALLVEDRGAATHAAAASAALERAGVAVARIALEPSEHHKTLDTFARIVAAALEAQLDRADIIIAVGGGIVGDVAGFAAAAYRRGVTFINVPTTLLAMVDASIGGKTGVNLPDAAGRLLKNMVGAFHPPALVVSDLDTLATLPGRVFRAGLGECVKHGLLGPALDQPDALPWLERHADRLTQAGDADVLRELVERSVRLKALVVAGDEREDPADARGRATLNLGHTYAHAMETLAGLSVPGWSDSGPLLHGEAVGLGLIAACRASAAAGLVEPALEVRVRAAVERLGLPAHVAGLPDDPELLDRMAADKKVIAGRRRLVLPVAGGGVRVVDGLSDPIVAAGWAAIRAATTLPHV